MLEWTRPGPEHLMLTGLFAVTFLTAPVVEKPCTHHKSLAEMSVQRLYPNGVDDALINHDNSVAGSVLRRATSFLVVFTRCCFGFSLSGFSKKKGHSSRGWKQNRKAKKTTTRHMTLAPNKTGWSERNISTERHKERATARANEKQKHKKTTYHVAMFWQGQSEEHWQKQNIWRVRSLSTSEKNVVGSFVARACVLQQITNASCMMVLMF